jgi:hypothetical protein
MASLPISEQGAHSKFTRHVIVVIALGLSVIGSTRSTAGASSVNISNAAGRNAACKASNVTHVFITILDIQGHSSGRGAGWQDLTPTLSNGPTQLDLLESAGESSEPPASNDCIISKVDSGTSGLPAGKYQQFRLTLEANGGSGAAPANNACASLGVFNCVELSDKTLRPLTVPRGAIKIPSSQISQGGLTIAPGQGADLDIDVDACSDISVSGGGKHKGGKGRGGADQRYMFKPVLHAGQISLNPLIAGDVVEGSASGSVVTAGNTGVPGASVWLEQTPAAPNFTEAAPAPGATQVNVDSVIVRAVTDSKGHFIFCPVATGKYSIVTASSGLPGQSNTSHLGNPSDITITTGVDVGGSGGPNNLVIPILIPSTGASSLAAQFTSQSATPVPSAMPTPVAATVNFGVAQGEPVSGNQDPIPLLSGTTTSPVTTTSNGTGTGGPNCSSSCPSGTDCACVSMVTPPDNPVVGAAGGPYSAPAANPMYSVFGTGTTCAPANLITAPTGPPLPEPTLSFLQCH